MESFAHGCARNTTPELAAGAVSFTNAWWCGTSTPRGLALREHLCAWST